MDPTDTQTEKSHSLEGLTGRIGDIDLSVVAAWLMGFGLVFYLSMEGGGYDTIVRNQVGIAIWWIAVVGVLAGALPVRKPNRLALVALGMLLGFVAWTAISLAWTESQERTGGELSRVFTYLGVFGLALLIRGPRGARHTVTAIGTAIALVALIALASRLHPDWFPEASVTAEFLNGAQSRLSYPLNYWNGLAELIAIGLPLVLYIATSARSLLVRTVAGGVLPAIALALFFTFSRSGTGAAIAGLVIFMVFTGDRIKAGLALIVAASGAAALIATASGKSALEDGLTGNVAQSQGDDLMLLTIAVCIVVAIVHGAISWILTERPRPRWMSPTKRESQTLVVGGVVAILLVAVAAGAPGQISDGWQEFKSADNPGSGSARLESAAGNGRYQYWSSALDQFSSAPVEGTGSGTFEFWWARNGDIPGFVRDTHSLYFQTAGELGAIGLLLLVGFLGLTVVGGAYRAIHASARRRGQIAAALGGCVAFCVAAGFDWTWQLAVIPIAFLMLSAVILTAGAYKPGGSLPWAGRATVAVLGLIALAAIAIPLASTTMVRESQSQARSGDISDALKSARTAVDIQPGAATPYMQKALVLELGQKLEPAARAARRATEKEPTNWRTWFVLSRIEAERGRVDASISAFREARRLNPRALLFQ